MSNHKIRITKDELANCISRKLTIWQVCQEFSVCEGTVRGYLKKYGFVTPTGFFSRGLKVGRKPGFKMSKKQRQEMSVRNKGVNNPFYGKKHTKVTRQKMSENHADFTGDNNPFKRACDLDPTVREALIKRQIKYWGDLTIEQRYQHNKKSNIYEDISRYFWTRLLHGAKNRNLEVTITPEYAWQIWLKQDGKCSLTGLDLNLKTCYELTASIDRINSNLGYIEGNIQWVHKVVNILKSNIDNQVFLNICMMITKHHLTC